MHTLISIYSTILIWNYPCTILLHCTLQELLRYIVEDLIVRSAGDLGIASRSHALAPSALSTINVTNDKLPFRVAGEEEEATPLQRYQTTLQRIAQEGKKLSTLL